MIVSASALHRHCGYPRALSRLAPKSARAQAAADLGTQFHAAAEAWSRTGWVAALKVATNDEVRGWLETLAMTWSPSSVDSFEEAMGLSTGGQYVEVDEPEPHVYAPRSPNAKLLTAGRADVVSDALTSGGSIAVVRDWKTGRYSVEHPSTNLQLHALGLAAASKLNADAYRLEIYYTRTGLLDATGNISVDSEEAARAFADVEAAALLDDQPRPGAHCDTCWEKRMKRCSHAT